MIYTYSAIFNDDKEGSCHISIPNLEYETDIDYSSHADMMKKSAQELGFALWLYESESRIFPNPSTISDKGLQEDEYIGFISCDYDKYKNYINIRNIPLD